MKRILFCLAALVLLAGCSDDGGGGGDQLTGTWKLTDADSTADVVINQSGTAVAMRVRSGYVIRGTYTQGILELAWNDRGYDEKLVMNTISADRLEGEWIIRRGEFGVISPVRLDRISHDILFHVGEGSESYGSSLFERLSNAEGE